MLLKFHLNILPPFIYYEKLYISEVISSMFDKAYKVNPENLQMQRLNFYPNIPKHSIRKIIHKNFFTSV